MEEEGEQQRLRSSGIRCVALRSLLVYVSCKSIMAVYGSRMVMRGRRGRMKTNGRAPTL